MRAMDIGRQSMYDTFGDKRALFLRALQMYVTESVHNVRAEVEKPGSALSAIQKRSRDLRRAKRLVQCGRLHGAQRNQ